MIKTPALQGIVQLPSAVGGQDDMGAMPGFYGPNLRDRDLKIRENFQKKGFEFFVGAVNLIDEQNGRFCRIVLNGLQMVLLFLPFPLPMYFDHLGHNTHRNLLGG